MNFSYKKRFRYDFFYHENDGLHVPLVFFGELVRFSLLRDLFECVLLCHAIVVTVLSYFVGCMICLGKSNYFRFNHPKEAKKIKESNPGNRFSIVPDQYYPGK